MRGKDSLDQFLFWMKPVAEVELGKPLDAFLSPAVGLVKGWKQMLHWCWHSKV